MKNLPEWYQKVYRPAEKNDITQKWLKLRKQCFKRDKYRCQMCLNFYGENSLSIAPHHIIPKEKAGEDILDNLITLCLKCHNIAEIEGLTKIQIIDYYPSKQEVPEKEKYIHKSKILDWHKWVYGGYDKPDYK